MASSGGFKSREAWKAAKELEEARKAGTAPPAVDDDGRIINPHIPEYISQAPWYLNPSAPSLKHQKSQPQRKRAFDALGSWLPRGQMQGPAATKYRKGACENCGAMTHTVKNCLERPRRRGAKLTGAGIRPDEVVATVELGFEGKRDRWNGFDEGDGFEEVRRRYEKREARRKALKAQRLDKELRSGARRRRVGSGSESDGSDESGDGGEKDGDGAVLGGTASGSKMSVRNLRIREDTAKYLYNLKTDSAYYDPKSRAMRADPNPEVDPEDKDYAGDNFVRFEGDVTKLTQMELHTMKANEMGRRLPHLQAEPSRAEALFKDFEAKKKGLAERRRANIIKKYGGQEHTKPDAGIGSVQQSEAYIEYSSDGRAMKGAKQFVAVSKYPEDILEKNHTAIWGSYYKDGKWGYGCCYQTQRGAFCTGEDGQRAAIATEKEMIERVRKATAARDPKPLTEQWNDKEEERIRKAVPCEEQAGKGRKKTIEIEKEMRRQEAEERRMEEDDRHRGYNSGKKGVDIDHMSDTAMEAYRLRRQIEDDPMSKFLSDKNQ